MFSKTVSARLRESSLETEKRSGSSVRHKGLAFLFCCLSVVALADSSQSQPVNTTQLTAWLTGGISSTRLVQLIHEPGPAVAPTKKELHQLQALRALPKLLRPLSRA